jgi:hypothetical protein
MVPPWDCSSRSLMAAVAPMFSSMPPLFFTHALCTVVARMAVENLRASVAASALPDTRTAGGQERQKPLVLAQGDAW